MNVLYNLQHSGYTPPPGRCRVDRGSRARPSYLDPRSGGRENDFTNRDTTFMTYNGLYLAKMLQVDDGISAYGTQRSQWDAAYRPESDNSEHR